jgi:hypothetical protein
MTSAEHGSLNMTGQSLITIPRIINHFPKPVAMQDTTVSRDFVKRTNRIRVSASMRPLLLQRRIDFMIKMMTSCPPIPE